MDTENTDRPEEHDPAKKYDTPKNLEIIKILGYAGVDPLNMECTYSFVDSIDGRHDGVHSGWKAGEHVIWTWDYGTAGISIGLDGRKIYRSGIFAL